MGRPLATRQDWRYPRHGGQGMWPSRSIHRISTGFRRNLTEFDPNYTDHIWSASSLGEVRPRFANFQIFPDPKRDEDSKTSGFVWKCGIPYTPRTCTLNQTCQWTIPRLLWWHWGYSIAYYCNLLHIPSNIQIIVINHYSPFKTHHLTLINHYSLFLTLINHDSPMIKPLLTLIFMEKKRSLQNRTTSHRGTTRPSSHHPALQALPPLHASPTAKPTPSLEGYPSWKSNLASWKIPSEPSGYVKIAIKNDHRNSGFTH
jgi:hypothetical protein